MEIYLHRGGVTAHLGCRMWPDSRVADQGLKAVQSLGWKPGLRVIVIVDEIIIIRDRLLISRTLEVAADSRGD